MIHISPLFTPIPMLRGRRDPQNFNQDKLKRMQLELSSLSPVSTHQLRYRGNRVPALGSAQRAWGQRTHSPAGLSCCACALGAALAELFSTRGRAPGLPDGPPVKAEGLCTAVSLRPRAAGARRLPTQPERGSPGASGRPEDPGPEAVWGCPPGPALPQRPYHCLSITADLTRCQL